MNFAEMPIVRNTNPFTNLLDGNDAGYRDVPLSPYDSENPDPLVITSLLAYPINYRGRTDGIMHMYPGGIASAPQKIAVRLPFERKLQQATAIVSEYDMDICILDGFRDLQTQRNFWSADHDDIIRICGLESKRLTVLEEVEVGRKADDNTSFAGIVKDHRFETAIDQLMEGVHGAEVFTAADILSRNSKKEITVREVAEDFVTFMANLGRNGLELDEAATTAHGNGGAADLWMFNQQTDKWANFGAPYSYIVLPGMRVSPTVINYFELVTPEEYAEDVARDPVLQWYLKYHGVTKVTESVFAEARANRRILYHAMREVGATYFSLAQELGEFWHFNGGNEDGGYQANVSGLDGSGNGCHAILKGKSMAAWTNTVGHAQARELGLIPAR